METHLFKSHFLICIGILISFFIPKSQVYGQVQLVYETEVELDYPFPVVLTDQGFALYTSQPGSDQFLKLRNDNVEIWSTQIQELPENHTINFLYEHASGFYYVGEGGLSSQTAFGRVNKTSGNVEVRKTYIESNSTGKSFAITSTIGNNLLIGGYIYTNTNEQHAIVRVVNQLGDVLLTKLTNETGGLWGNTVYQILQTKDNGYLLAGRIFENNNCGEIANASLWLCKLDEDLNVIWSKKYGDGNGSVNKAYGSDHYGPKCIITPNNDIIVLGTVLCTDGNGGGPANIGEGDFLMKLNAAGNISIIKHVGISFPDFTKYYTGIDNGCSDYFVLSGVQGGLLGSSYFIEKFDNSLESVEFLLVIDDTDKATRFVEVTKGKSDAYLLSGQKYYYDMNGDYHTRTFLAKTTSDPGCAHCDNIPLNLASYSDCENFNALALGDISPQGNPRFTLFSGDPTEQATVINNAPGNPGQALKFGNFSDIDYNIGRTIQTPARLEWRMYFPIGKTGSWGLETNSPSPYGLGVDYNNGVATLFSQGNQVNTFTYSQNSWFKLALIFNPSTNSIEFWSSGSLIYTVSNFQSDKVTDLNFFYDDASSNNTFYVDDILYYETSSNCNAVLNGSAVCVNNNDYDYESEALCDGYTENEWSVGTCCTSFTITNNLTHTACGINNGAITVTPNGVGSVTYLWSNGSTSQTISGLSPGTFTVTITANGCAQTSSYTVNGSTAISVQSSTVDESCNNCNNGQATANPSGGSGYTYQWSNGGTTQTINNLAPGTYTVTVTSNNGCTATSTIAINEFGCAGIAISFVQTDPVCFGDCNATAIATPTGGSSPYTYLWNTGTSLPAAIGLCEGMYTVTILDGNGCNSIGTITIAPGNQLISEITQMVDTLTAVVSGGTAPYTYNWSTGATTPRIFPKSNGIYSVTIIDANGCSTTRVYSFIYTANEILADFPGKIYPNPAYTEIHVDFSMPDDVYSISLYDFNGSLVLNNIASAFNGSATIDVSRLVPGLYVMKMSGSDKQYFTKVIKM